MIRKSIEIAAPKPTPVEMEILWVRNRLPDPDLKFRKEILAEPLRHTVVPPQNLVHIALNTPVKSSFHVDEAQRRVRRK
jgi:hypothetical protein